jgi:hypothetical protein
MKQKVAAIPNIALGAKYQVINEKTMRWETIGQGLAAPNPVQAFMKANNLTHIWVNDGFGREYVSVKV